MRLRYALIFITAVAIVTVNHVQKELFTPRLEAMVIYNNYYANERDPAVTCQFPILHPFDESILSHIRIAMPIRCFARSKLLTMIDRNGTLCFNKSALAEAGYDEDSPPSCYYQEILRAEGSDFDVVYGPKLPMTGQDRPTSDFVYIECKNFVGISVYQNFHASVQRNYSVRKFKDDTELGVAVIGLDSMSRLNFMRQLSLTYRYLTKTLDGVVLLGFNKVGENTYPNLIPMLTGRPHGYGDVDHYEHWPFVWKHFAAEGAATMYSEDLPQFNMFDYLAPGLRTTPTHHYMRTYWLATEKSVLYRMSSSSCLGALPKHLIYFNYLLSFLRTYKDSPIFLFSLFNEASHDYINSVGAIDKDLTEFLNTSFSEGLFNRTVVFILGDHGNRIDSIRLTDVGRIEDRMPMVSVVLPEWTDKVYPGWRQALHKNSKRLLSSYDLHGTFLDILSTLRKPGAEDVRKAFEFNRLRESGLDVRWAKHFSNKSAELTLFKPVPVTRSCDDAGIPTWFCVCQTDQEKLSTTDKKTWRAAETVVEHFNKNILSGLSQCAKQNLVSVHSAILIRNKKQPLQFRIQVVFQTEPGNGVFEASVEVRSIDSREEWTVVGELLRINRYGTQADCLPSALRVNSTILRGVCFCK